MTAKQIQKRLKELRKQRLAIDLKIDKLQKSCKHEGLVYQNKADTGNYDPSQDCYYTIFFCQDCKDRWSADGSYHGKGIKVEYGHEIHEYYGEGDDE